MSKAKGALWLLLIASAALVWTPSAWADSQARIVRLSLVRGPVQIDRGDGFEKAILNMPIMQGMKLWTQGDSRAEVEFEDGVSMRLAPGATVEFERLTLLSSGAKSSLVRVTGGKVYFNVPRKGENDFRIAFEGRQLSLTRGVRLRLDLTPEQAGIAVLKGELVLDEHTKLKKNETAVLNISGSGTGSLQLAKGITPSPFDQWDASRLNFEKEYASAAAGNVPYYYGRGDLNYYGSWGYVPGYGNLWRPFDVGYGWDPFSAGAWAWYPGWGYTWVSAYPWGWIPYRYGSWVWAPNYGWCWRPGGYSSWYAVPAVINPPPAFQPLQPPSLTGTAGSGGGTPRPPTIVVRRDEDVIRSRVAVPAVAGTTAPRTGSTTAGTTPAQPSRPVQTFVPRSGPGTGRRPAAMDDNGVFRQQGRGMRQDGVRPAFNRGGAGVSAARRSSGSAPAAARPSAPSRPSSPHAPPSRPRQN